MKFYKLTCICTFIVLLSGCNTFLTKTEVQASKVTSEVVKSEPVVEDITDEESVRTSFPIEIDEEIAAPIGESKSYLLMMEMYHSKYPYQILVQKALYTKFEM
ncbi:hypothetical protein ABH966_005243 [Lysinibacillus sp. RC46]|uniref:hypothetical protein n=1 Tax=Lysinibacillus sp. RC46 TaxID=3156295 RepID=UPI0035156C41